jgi:acetyl esterase/lipase
MSLTFEEAELAEARRVNRLLASAPRLPLRTQWDVAIINGALTLSQALPDSSLKRAHIAVEDRRVVAGGRDAMVRILRPQGACRGVYVDIHGGAWVLGNARMDDRINAQLVETCHVAVVSVDYRLALKNPVRTVLDDCETAALWVLENLEDEFGDGPPRRSGCAARGWRTGSPASSCFTAATTSGERRACGLRARTP